MSAPLHRGLRHVALRVTNLARSRTFYEQLLGMKVVWEPDPDNVYFSSGSDNFALHQIPASELAAYQPLTGQSLDHIGVILESPEAVDRMYREVEPRLPAAGRAGRETAEAASRRQLFLLLFRSRRDCHSSVVRTYDQ